MKLAVDTTPELTQKMAAKIALAHQKQTEKILIQTSVASATITKVHKKLAKLANSEKDTLSVTKQSVESVTSDLEDSLKGAWGKKATETFKKNSGSFDDV